MSYTLVGCRHCRNEWIVEDLRTNDRATCSRCGSAHETANLKTLGHTESAEHLSGLRQRRSNRLANGRDDDVATYDELARQVEARDSTTKYEAAAERYLNRRSDTLDRLVRSTLGESTTDTDTDSTVEPATAAGLTVGGSHSVTADVYLPDPPVSATAMFETLWEHDVIRSRMLGFVTALRTDSTDATAAHYRLRDMGVSAYGGTYASLAVDLAGDGLRYTRATQLHDRWSDSMLSGMPLTRDALRTGPLALLAAHARHTDDPATVEVEPPSDFWSHSTEQRRRWVRFVAALSAAADVRVVCSPLSARKFRVEYGDLLPARVDYRENVGGRGDRLATEGAGAAREALGPDSPHYEVLRVLSSYEGESAAYADLYADDRLADAEGTVRSQVATLRDHDLVDTFAVGTATHVALRRAGGVLLDMLAAEAPDSEQFTLSDAVEKGRSLGVDDPLNHTAKTVSPDSRTGAPARVGGDGGGRAGVRWCSLHRHHATAASARPGEVAIADEQAPDRDSEWERHVSVPDGADEVVVSVEASMKMWNTATKLCGALAADAVLERVLTDERCRDGGDPLGALLDGNTWLLQRGRQVGWLPSNGGDAETLRERLAEARDDIIRRSGAVLDADDVGAAASTLLRDAHGLLGTVTHLFDMLGVDVTREITVSHLTDNSEDATAELGANLARFVATQSAICSHYADRAAYRVLYEERPEKRDATVTPPDVDLTDPHGDVLGSWVIRGRGANALRPALSRLDAHLDDRLQSDADGFEAFYLDLTVTSTTSRDALYRTMKRVLDTKRIAPTRKALALFRTLLASPWHVARGLWRLGAEGEGDDRRDTYLDEVRWVLATAPSEALLRDAPAGLGITPTVQKVVATLLRDGGADSTAALAERADVATTSIGNNREAFDALDALGLLDRADDGPGTATTWRLRLPEREERFEFDAAHRPPYLVDEWSGHGYVPDVEHVLDGVLDSLGEDLSAHSALWRSLSLGTAEVSDLTDRWSWVRPYLEVVARLLDARPPGLPPATGERVVTVGAAPEAAQATLHEATQAAV